MLQSFPVVSYAAVKGVTDENHSIYLQPSCKVKDCAVAHILILSSRSLTHTHTLLCLTAVLSPCPEARSSWPTRQIQEAVSGNAPHNSVTATPEKSSSDMWTEQRLKTESRKHRKVWKTKQAEESYKSVVSYWSLSQIVWCMILLYNYYSSSDGTLTSILINYQINRK